ncbi:helix-turn-helix domain-containing protein [Oceanobacillus oncorhynchi]|uniref:helix-turn-helix domain-containing protein n=1 Tax=Oceanobacillus oncorhynchi TaxID=545501 RepID=UPI0034D5C9B4
MCIDDLSDKIDDFRTQKLSYVSKNIKMYRKKRGFSQKEFAEFLKMHYQNYSKMERGVYTPSLAKLLEICDILRITPNDLLTDNFEERKSEEDNFFIKSFVKNLKSNLEKLKLLEQVRESEKIDQNFLNHCKGGIFACDQILDFMKELNANEK